MLCAQWQGPHLGTPLSHRSEVPSGLFTTTGMTPVPAPITHIYDPHRHCNARINHLEEQLQHFQQWCGVKGQQGWFRGNGGQERQENIHLREASPTYAPTPTHFHEASATFAHAQQPVLLAQPVCQQTTGVNLSSPVRFSSQESDPAIQPTEPEQQMAARQTHARTFVASPPQTRERKSAGSTLPYRRRHTDTTRSTYSDIESQYRATTHKLIDDYRNRRKGLPSKCTFKIEEGDLLDAAEQYKVTSVAADLKYRRGVEAQLASRFGAPMGILKKPAPGDVLESASKDSSVLFLVTKNKAHEHPHRKFGKFIRNVQKAIEKLARIIIKRGITEIAMPFICSGKQQLNWLYVRELLRHNLRDINVRVTVYYIPRERLLSPRSTPIRTNLQRSPRLETQQEVAEPVQQIVQASTEREEMSNIGPLSISPVVSNLINRYEHKCSQQGQQWPCLQHPMSNPKGRKH